MDWLQTLFTDTNSIAHIVLLYAFVIAVGVLLGKIKFFGISLGVTFVLFMGIVCGHFGFTGNVHILNFLQDFGLILFVFCIGLQVGPSFFSSFKKGGISMNIVATGIVLLNIAVALCLYYALGGRIDLPMMVGVLCGAVTNTPGLGAANEALTQIGYDGPQIAMGYACAYPLGVLGIIGSIILVKYLCRVNLKKEEQEIEQQKTARRHVFIVALCIGIAALVAMLFAAYAIRQRRREPQKNRVLAEQIAETLDYKNMYMELRASPSPVPADAPTRLSGEQDAKEASADPASLFRYLSDVIIHERLYLDPAIGRQMLSDRFHLSDHLIGTAFAQGSSYKSLPEFIRSLRLEHACGLLRERPDMTISEVATASGFSNLNVFSRYFKAKYMMTPTDFCQLN